jgi:hypothetical protein
MWKFVTTKKSMITNFFSPPPLFCCCFLIRDPRSGIRYPGSGMGKNQDPQHWHQVRTSPPTVIDQPDLFTAVLSPAEKEGEH